MKFFFDVETNLFHFVRMLPLDGEVWIEMPNSLSETWLQYCTTQRLGGILEVVNTRKDLRRRLTSLRIAQILSHDVLVQCEYDVTSYLVD